MNDKKVLDEIAFDFNEDSDVLGSFLEDTLFERMTAKPLSDNSGNELKPISASESMSDSSSDFTINSLFDGYSNPNLYDTTPIKKYEKISTYNKNIKPKITIKSHPESSLQTNPIFHTEPMHLSQNINTINIPSTVNTNLIEITKYKEDIESYEMRLKEYENSLQRIKDELNDYKSKETQWNIKEAQLENNIREKESIICELKSENSNQAISQAQLEKEKENCLLTKELQYSKEIEEIKSKYESQMNQLQTEVRIKEFEYKNEINTQKQEYEQQILELQNQCSNDLNLQSNESETDIEYQAKLHELEEKNNEIECELCKMKIEYDNKENEIIHLKNKINNNEINYNKLMELYNNSITESKKEIKKYLQQIFDFQKEINIKAIEINEYREQMKKIQSYNCILIDQNKENDKRLEEIMKLKLEIEKMRNSEEMKRNIQKIESNGNNCNSGDKELVERLKYENLQLKKDLIEINNKFKKVKESVLERVKEFKKSY